jgi:hypothetical protein
MARPNSSPATFRPDVTDVARITLWALIVFITWLFMHGADHFLRMTPEALGKYFDHKYVIIAHITAGGGSLILGLAQFWPRLRSYSWKLHRVIGFFYLMAVLVSSSCALILAFTTARTVNWAYAFSLQVWVVVWISATAVAYYAAIRRNFLVHREWMVRSYLVTLAFVISGLALRMPAVKALGPFEEISPSLFWMGWSGPLYIYQLLLAVRSRE